MRGRLLPLAALVPLLGGCLDHVQEVVPPGEFYVEMDPARGTVQVIPTIGATSVGLVQVGVVLDGVPDSGPPDTLEATGAVAGRGEAVCGYAASFCADITLRSFFAHDRLYNAYVEITRQTPGTGNHLLNPFTAPFGLGDYFGVYGYATLYPAGQPNDRVTRRWVIEDNGVALRFRARVYATVYPDP